MAKERFNEAERYLIRQWSSARLLEESMERVREKYAEVFERIAESVKAQHDELDWQRAYLTQFWGSGGIGFARQNWRALKGWHPGLYLSNMRLERLCSEDEERPHAGIWIPRKLGIDLEKARDLIRSAANSCLTKEEQKLCLSQAGDDEDPVYYELPETRKQLLEMLVEGDARRFIDCMVSHIDILAKFTPVLDKILAKEK